MNVSPTRRPSGRSHDPLIAIATAITTVALLLLVLAAESPPALAAVTGVDLATYKRVARFDLPAQPDPAIYEKLGYDAGGITYNWDTDTLFVVGDGGTSVLQVDKTGQLIDSMILAPGSSPKGTVFFDPEGIAYIGSGQFVMTEERDRRIVRFTYAPGTTLTRETADTVQLGTTIGNVGFEGVTNDPASGGFVVVKEMNPQSIFQTGIDWTAGAATNGSPDAQGSTNLFDPDLAGLPDFVDVFALSNLPTIPAPESNNLLVLSRDAGKIVEIDRSGQISSWMAIVNDLSDSLSVIEQAHEGLTVDNDGRLYLVNENGGGDHDHPELWVYEPSTDPNQAPTAVNFTNSIDSLSEATVTTDPIRLAHVHAVDDGIGNNQFSLNGPDAANFVVDHTGLYLKAGTTLKRAVKSTYTVRVVVDDPTVGASPDATSANFTLRITAVPVVAVTETSPWSSTGNTPYNTDWWELTNFGGQAIDVGGWHMDDNSDSFAESATLDGISELAPKETALFIEGGPTEVDLFVETWFDGNLPPGLQIGTYLGSDIGLHTTGDHVNVFDSSGNKVTGVSFGPATPGHTFDNAAGIGSTESPPPLITRLSVAGVNGAFTAGAETGSPGRIANPPTMAISIAVPTFPAVAAGSIGSGQWATVTNTGGAAGRISSASIQAANAGSVGEFLIAANQCAGRTLSPSEACRIQIRFAPRRANATSSADLVLVSDAPNSPTSARLTATSTAPPRRPPVSPGTGDRDGSKALRVAIRGVRRINRGEHSLVRFKVATSNPSRLRLVLHRGGRKGPRLAAKRTFTGRRAKRVIMRLHRHIPRRAKLTLVVVARDRIDGDRARKVVRL